MDFGKGLDFWKTMPTRRRTSMTSVPGALTSSPFTLMVPVTVTLSMRSFIRLRHRRRVDFPQPEGPMRAVTRRSSMSMVMSCSTWLSP